MRDLPGSGMHGFDAEESDAYTQEGRLPIRRMQPLALLVLNGPSWELACKKGGMETNTHECSQRSTNVMCPGLRSPLDSCITLLGFC